MGQVDVFGIILALNCLCVDGRDRSAQSAGVQAFVDQDQTVAGGNAGFPSPVWIDAPFNSSLCERRFGLSFRESSSTTMPTSPDSSTATR